MGILDPIYITDRCTRLIDFVLIANGVMIDHTVGLSKFAKRLTPWNFGIIFEIDMIWYNIILLKFWELFVMSY